MVVSFRRRKDCGIGEAARTEVSCLCELLGGHTSHVTRHTSHVTPLPFEEAPRAKVGAGPEES